MFFLNILDIEHFSLLTTEWQEKGLSVYIRCTIIQWLALIKNLFNYISYRNLKGYKNVNEHILVAFS